MFTAVLQTEMIRVETACARARARREVLVELISETQEMLADSANMDREQVALLKTRFLQQLIELDRFDRDVARPAEDMRASMIARLAELAAERELERSLLN